jgi:hypothetical protein
VKDHRDLIIAALVHRLGGKARVTVADISAAMRVDMSVAQFDDPPATEYEIRQPVIEGDWRRKGVSA